MSQDLLQRLQKDKNFQAEVKKNQQRYEVLQQASQNSKTESIPQQILRKVQSSRQLYFYFGYLQPTLKNQMYQVALYLIKHFKPNVNKPYTLVFFNEKCVDNYVLWNFRETFSYLKIEQIAAIEEFIVVKPYFYHKTMDWMTFGTIPKFIRSKTKFVYSYQQLCDHLKCSINILAENVPSCLYEEQLPNLFMETLAVQSFRMNFKGQERSLEQSQCLLQFQKSIKSMIMKPGYQINNLEDYQIGAEGVPNILKMLVFYFDNHPEGLQLQGIFRKSVSIDEENETISQILSKNYDYLLQVGNAHIIANLIKRFFSSLKTPVFPFHSFSQLMNDQGIKDKTQHLKKVYNQLPELNKTTLIFIFTFFKEKVIPKESQTKMGIQNMSICFAPCIFRSEKPSTADLIYASKAVLYCKLLLTQFETIFGSKQERQALYRRSYMQNKKNFQQNLDMGLQMTMDIAEQNLTNVKNSSRISHQYSDKQVSNEVKIQCEQIEVINQAETQQIQVKQQKIQERNDIKQQQFVDPQSQQIEKVETVQNKQQVLTNLKIAEVQIKQQNVSEIQKNSQVQKIQVQEDEQNQKQEEDKAEDNI